MMGFTRLLTLLAALISLIGFPPSVRASNLAPDPKTQPTLDAQ